MKLWENASRWKPQGVRFEAWLCRIATNASLDRLRRRPRELGADAAGDTADGAPSAVDRISTDERRRAVEAALAALPERQRIAVTLCHLQDLSNIEAAAAMNVSVEAVEALLTRGRRALREALTGLRDELLEGASG